MDQRLEAVHELWSAFREHGAGGAIPLLDPGVEFAAHATPTSS